VGGNHILFSFLTTAPNAEVGQVHEKAMPVCLLTEADTETWMQADVGDALALQRPSKDGALRVVAAGRREDP
jgi:putative SOS response-associated peptidase YedK